MQRKATGIGGCEQRKIKKEMIYSPFLSFALIKLRYYCDFNDMSLIKPTGYESKGRAIFKTMNGLRRNEDPQRTESWYQKESDNQLSVGEFTSTGDAIKKLQPGFMNISLQKCVRK